MKRTQLIFTSIVLGVFVHAIPAQGPASAFDTDPWPMAKAGPVKVFIMAGQSNMQGHASLRTLEYLIYNEETAKEYRQWKDRWGNWCERSDVWIWTTDGKRYGNLKPGYGGNENQMEMGPELGFGWVIGEHFNEQVLLIKTCWGGRSVKKDFLPPSAEMPSDAVLQKELEDQKKRNPNLTLDEVKSGYGRAYRDMMATTRDVLDRLTTYLPKYEKERGYELAGLVFFQGWNDMVDGSQGQEKYVNYTKRLAAMIRDVRRDLQVPGLPVIIGEMGASARGDFQKAQAAVLDEPGMTNVKFVKTRDFWEPEVEKMVNENVWRGPDWVKFYNVGSERGYHYLGSAKIMYKMGKAFGEGMTELLSKR